MHTPDEDEYDFMVDRFGADLDDDMGYDDPPRRELKCRDCGSENVYWVERDGKYVLYDMSSRRHKCNAEHVTASRLDAFENLD